MEPESQLSDSQPSNSHISDSQSSDSQPSNNQPSDSQPSDSQTIELPTTLQRRKVFLADINRDDRVRIQLLYGLGWRYKDISEELGVTVNQI